MNFERGGDIKDTLKIGRFPNAIEVSGYYILGKIVYDDGGMSKNFGFSTSDKKGTLKILSYLKKGELVPSSVCRRLFYNHIKRNKRTYRMVTYTPSSRGFGRGELIRHIDKLDHAQIDSRIKISQFDLVVKCNYQPHIGNVKNMMFHEAFGKDLLYNGELYPVPEVRSI
jgi:hypothetical protein